MMNRPDSFRRAVVALCFFAALAGASEASAAEAPMPQPPTPAEPAGRGVVLSFGTGGAFLGGEIGKGLPISGAQATFDIRFGGYFTNRIGVVAGIQGGYGSLIEGCASKCSNAFSYQLPIVAQVSLQDRLRGAYFEGGLAILSTYGASTGKEGSASPEALQVRSIADLKLGIGYRFAAKTQPGSKATTTAMDIRFGVDLGQFDKVEYRAVGTDVDGDVRPEMKALHYAFSLGVGYHFAP